MKIVLSNIKPTTIKHIKLRVSEFSINGARRTYSTNAFVPHHDLAKDTDVERLKLFIGKSWKLLVITGAGISTESGIPDYRSEGVGLYVRSSRRPVQYQDFIKHAKIRKNYWARNYNGWPFFSSVKPNINHTIITQWEEMEILTAIVTQNVDCLHQKSCAKNVIELHGTAFMVKCLNCDFKIERPMFQEVLANRNPSFHISVGELRPDGDVDLSQEQVESFIVPSCPLCMGVLKPDIVFFGESVPMKRVETVYKHLDSCDKVLVLGSSLMVYSGYRFVLRAVELGKPVGILNIGPTRADHLCNMQINARCGDVLGRL